MAFAGPASAAEPAASRSCTYVRLSLSSPQRLAKSAEDAELQKRYRDVFALHLARAGFDVSAPTTSAFAWEVFSHVEPIGDGRLAWSYAFLPSPGVLDGAIEFPTFSVVDRGQRVQFTTYHGLDHFRSNEYPLRAAIESERLASLYLPVARSLCATRDASPEHQRARLERIRAELAAEIERVRVEQHKHLELDVDASGDGD